MVNTIAVDTTIIELQLKCCCRYFNNFYMTVVIEVADCNLELGKLFNLINDPFLSCAKLLWSTMAWRLYDCLMSFLLSSFIFLKMYSTFFLVVLDRTKTV